MVKLADQARIKTARSFVDSYRGYELESHWMERMAEKIRFPRLADVHRNLILKVDELRIRYGARLSICRLDISEIRRIVQAKGSEGEKEARQAQERNGRGKTCAPRYFDC